MNYNIVHVVMSVMGFRNIQKPGALTTDSKVGDLCLACDKHTQLHKKAFLPTFLKFYEHCSCTWNGKTHFDV